MNWSPELDELRQREKLAQQMGGPEKVARQHSRGKMDARQRLTALVDEGSFREIGAIAGKGDYDANGELTGLTPAPFLYGTAKVHGRPIVATADDFTIRGGAGDAAIYRKMIQAEMMAHQYRMPLVRMIDGTGGGGSVRTLEDDRRDLRARRSGLVRRRHQSRHRARRRAGAGTDGGAGRGAGRRRATTR